MESTPNPRVLVIMPAWNESEAVGNTVREVLNTDSRYDVLVVNDGSTDDTAAVAAEAGATVLNLPLTSVWAAPCGPASSTRAAAVTVR